MIDNLALLPTVAGAPGRSFACAGVRAYIHRLVGYIGPDCNVLIKSSSDGTSLAPDGDGVGHSASDLLLRAITTATPYLVAFNHPNESGVLLEDPDVRWKELKEHIPLFSQLVLRYKVSVALLHLAFVLLFDSSGCTCLSFVTRLIARGIARTFDKFLLCSLKISN